ncbi:hypothetical protein [Bremerella sp. P1]|uniref:hypothetical protein n=1 Tax=Bremerella sp. P1 TaxID=3026424 RepID=UPI002368900D|nr:hypothetical protein [Bremerella sp. P1]WDI43705.1 hypothetical protein PSR63_07065 [Bremerella sp. P1]
MSQMTSEPDSRRQTFMQNLNQLLEVARMNRKESAETIGVPYKWLRRMVSTGLVRSDERNLADLQKVTTFFAVPELDDLWRPHLVCWLVESDSGEAFWDKFEKNLFSIWSELEQALRAIDQQLLRTLRWHCRERSVSDDAIAFHPSSDVVSDEEKVQQILASDKADHFKDFINVYYEAITSSIEQSKTA